jgi:hypothetical protein
LSPNWAEAAQVFCAAAALSRACEDLSVLLGRRR